MLVCDVDASGNPVDRSPKFIEREHVALLEALHRRIAGVVQAWAAQDSDQADDAALVAHRDKTGAAFEADYSRELEAARHLEQTIRDTATRAQDFEAQVRMALEKGLPPPASSASEAIVRKVLMESREHRVAAYQGLEGAGSAYVVAAKDAALYRTGLVVADLETKLKECEPLHRALDAAVARAQIVRN